MGVWGVAGGHAPTSLEPAEAAFNRVARWWGAGLRSQVPGARGRSVRMPRGTSQVRKASPS